MSVLSDPISDFLTRLKNASRARNEEFTAPYSKIKAEIARILAEEGYIWSYELDTSGKFPEIRVKTKFVNAAPALTDLKRVSRPGLRQYRGKDELPKIQNGLGVAVISTSKGIMTDAAARAAGEGGEVLCIVT